MLRDEGLVDSRQGFGWFVAADPRAPVAGPARHDRGAAGRARAWSSERRVVGFRFVAAPPRVRQVLGVDTVLEVRRVNLADGQPFARVTVWCPEDGRGPALAGRRRELAVLRARRVALGGATQTIGAAAAGRDDAALLAVPVGSPVLRCERVTTASTGGPLLVSRARVPGAPHRVRGRAAPRGAVDRPVGPAPGRVTAGAVSPAASVRPWRRACTPATTRRPLLPPPRRRASP